MESAKEIKFDGKDHPELDPKAADRGAAYSARRVNARTLEVTDKFKGRITGTRQFELSPDLKTLTITEHPVGQNKPKSVLVLEILVI